MISSSMSIIHERSILTESFDLTPECLIDEIEVFYRYECINEYLSRIKKRIYEQAYHRETADACIEIIESIRMIFCDHKKSEEEVIRDIQNITKIKTRDLAVMFDGNVPFFLIVSVLAIILMPTLSLLATFLIDSFIYLSTRNTDLADNAINYILTALMGSINLRGFYLICGKLSVPTMKRKIRKEIEGVLSEIDCNVTKKIKDLDSLSRFIDKKLSSVLIEYESQLEKKINALQEEIEECNDNISNLNGSELSKNEYDQYEQLYINRITDIELELNQLIEKKDQAADLKYYMISSFAQERGLRKVKDTASEVNTSIEGNSSRPVSYDFDLTEFIKQLMSSVTSGNLNA